MEYVEDDVLMFINWKYFQPNQLHLPPTTLLTVHFKFSRVNIDFEHAAGIGIEPGVQQLYSTPLT